MAAKRTTPLKAAVKAAKKAPVRTRTPESARTVTRTASGRARSEPEWQTRKREIERAGVRLANRYDRVDSPLRGPRQLGRVWFMPPEVGGKHWWIPRGTTATTIGGYGYRPNSPWPHTTRERPGLSGRIGLQHGAAIPDPVWQAANFSRATHHKSSRDDWRKIGLLGKVFGPAEEPRARGVTGRTTKKLSGRTPGGTRWW